MGYDMSETYILTQVITSTIIFLSLQIPSVQTTEKQTHIFHSSTQNLRKFPLKSTLWSEIFKMAPV